jgi:hypothetical protein
MLHSYPLDPDVEYRFVITASPALFKAMPPQEAVRFVHRYSQLQYRGINAAEALTLEAQQRAQKVAQQAALAGDGGQVRSAAVPAGAAGGCGTCGCCCWPRVGQAAAIRQCSAGHHTWTGVTLLTCMCGLRI